MKKNRFHFFCLFLFLQLAFISSEIVAQVHSGNRPDEKDEQIQKTVHSDTVMGESRQVKSPLEMSDEEYAEYRKEKKEEQLRKQKTKKEQMVKVMQQQIKNNVLFNKMVNFCCQEYLKRTFSEEGVGVYLNQEPGIIKIRNNTYKLSLALKMSNNGSRIYLADFIVTVSPDEILQLVNWTDRGSYYPNSFSTGGFSSGSF